MIFVTGGTGLVGSHLLYNLTCEGHKIRALYRDENRIEVVKQLFNHYGANAEQLMANIEWVKGDLLDYFLLIDALKDVKQVYHCAAMVSFKPNEAKEMFNTNVDGTANLVNASIEKNIDCFCFVSSIATLGGSQNGAPIDESTLWQNDDNHSVYSQSKFRSEMEVWRGTKEGLKAVVVNPSVIIGPVGEDRSTGPLLKTVRDGLKFYTMGSTGFVDVRDVVKAMISLCNSDITNERFIINSENLSYQSFLQLASEVFGVKAPKYKAGRILTGIAWRLERLKYYILRREPSMTKETARTSQHKSVYSDAKLQSLYPLDYIPIKDALFNANQFIKNGSN